MHASTYLERMEVQSGKGKETEEVSKSVYICRYVHNLTANSKQHVYPARWTAHHGAQSRLHLTNRKSRRGGTITGGLAIFGRA